MVNIEAKNVTSNPGFSNPENVFQTSNSYLGEEIYRLRHSPKEVLGKGSLSIDSIDHALETVLSEILENNIISSPRQLLSEVSNAIPFRISREVSDKAVKAVKSSDPEVSEKGKKAIVFLFSGSILSGIERFMTGDENENDDICQFATETVINTVSRREWNLVMSQIVYESARRGAQAYLSLKDGIPANWADPKKNTSLKQAVDNGWKSIIKGESLEEIAIKLSIEFDLNRSVLLDYLHKKYSKEVSFKELEKTGHEDEALNDIENDIDRAKILEIISALPSTELQVLQLRHGLVDGKSKNFSEIGKELDLQVHYVSRLYLKALTKLRNPGVGMKLRALMGDEVPDYYLKSANSQVFQSRQPKNDLEKQPKSLKKPIQSAQLNARTRDQQRWKAWEANHPLPKKHSLLDETERYEAFINSQADSRE